MRIKNQLILNQSLKIQLIKERLMETTLTLNYFKP
jgi:hypothetical protein